MDCDSESNAYDADPDDHPCVMPFQRPLNVLGNAPLVGKVFGCPVVFRGMGNHRAPPFRRMMRAAPASASMTTGEDGSGAAIGSSWCNPQSAFCIVAWVVAGAAAASAASAASVMSFFMV